MAYGFRSLCLAMLLLCTLSACAGETQTAAVNTTEVADDYYIDLTDLGMKLVIYLRLDEEGGFCFSNTTAFEVNKSSGTFQKSGDAYIMVYDSVNGEEKSASDGLTSSFTVMEDGSLDFSGCEKIYYGSASANTVSADDSNIKLTAKVISDDFEMPDTHTDFQFGTYAAKTVSESGITYSHMVTFYEDNSYLHVMRYKQDGKVMFESEIGTYGVHTTQLALNPSNAEAQGTESRVECEIVDASNLKLAVAAYAGDKERTLLEFEKTEGVSLLGTYEGTIEQTEGAERIGVTLLLYEDGSYEASASGFTEKGILVMDSENGYVKQYPNHPESGTAGLKQIETVPSGILSYADGKLVLEELRIRISENLTRYKCTVK